MLGPVAADNAPFGAGSELESVTTQSYRPHVVKGTKPHAPKVTKHNSMRTIIVIIIMCHHQSCSFLKKYVLLLEAITTSCNFYSFTCDFFNAPQAQSFEVF